MKTAKFIKNIVGWTGDARLFQLSEPIEYDDGKKTEFVVVSSTHAMFSGPETYIFPASEDGEVTDFGELPGSQRGDVSHESALADAGFEVA